MWNPLYAQVMAGLTSQELESLVQFKARLTRQFGGRLRTALLFGSKARGTACHDSDVDVLVVLEEKKWHDEKQIFGTVTEVFLETGVMLSPKVLDTEQVSAMRRQGNVFMQYVDQAARPL